MRNLYYAGILVLVSLAFPLILDVTAENSEDSIENSARIPGQADYGETVKLYYWLAIDGYYNTPTATNVQTNEGSELLTTKLGTGQTITAFDDEVVGMSKGVEKRFIIDSTEHPYTDAPLGGKDLYYSVVISSIIDDDSGVAAAIMSFFVGDNDQINVFNVLLAVGLVGIIAGGAFYLLIRPKSASLIEMNQEKSQKQKDQLADLKDLASKKRTSTTPTEESKKIIKRR